MQRELKFRGKDVKTEEMVTGSLVIVDCNGVKGYIIVTNPDVTGKHLAEPDALLFDKSEISVVFPDSVSQCTGLKDILGRDVYEGDEVRYDGQRTGKIVWYEPAAAFMFKEDIAEGFVGLESLTFKKKLEIVQPQIKKS